MTGPGLQEWFALSEILPHVGRALPGSISALTAHAEREGWNRDARRCQMRWGKGGGRTYHFTVLPAEVHARLILAQAPTPPAEAKAHSSAIWAAFERASNGARLKASERLSALDAVHAMTGMTCAAAVAHVAAHRGIAPSSLWSWIGLVAGVDRSDRLPALLPRHVGRTATAPCDPRAWDVLVADYLRPEQRCFEPCYALMMDVARREGWSPIPSAKTLKRRIEREFPRAQRELARKGLDAARKLYPAQRRDRTILRALEAVNADGHKVDVHCRFEDGTVGRPVLTVFQDLHSGLILSCRVDRSENREIVRLALRDMVKAYGIPERCVFDNGRHFASKQITGGNRSRFRFKIRDEEPDGILKALGIEVTFTQPYSGQSKPIERAFRDFCENIAKHPAFAGAYTGNSPVNKPSNYGSHAVPIIEFKAVLVTEIERHNAKPGRRSAVCGGKLSFRQAYERSLAEGAMPRVATDPQLRMLLLAAEGVRANRQNGSVEIFGTRYWHERLVEHAGEDVVARFDPEDLTQPLAVYTRDNRLITDRAEAIGDVAFFDQAAARDHGRNRRAYIKAIQESVELERRLSLDDLVALQPRLDEPAAPPVRRVVRMVANGRPQRDPFDEHPAEPSSDVAELLERGVQMFAEGTILPFRKEEGDA